MVKLRGGDSPSGLMCRAAELSLTGILGLRQPVFCSSQDGDVAVGVITSPRA